MGLVIFLVGPASKPLDAAVSAIFIEQVIDELIAVVAIESFEVEGKIPPHLLDRPLNLRCAFA